MKGLVPTATTVLAFLVAVSPANAERDTGSNPKQKLAFEVDGQKLLAEQVATAAEDTVYFVRAGGSKALADAHGVEVVEDAAVPAIVVQLSWKSYEDSIYDVRVEARRVGEPPVLVEEFECECSNSELAAAVRSRLPAALEQLDDRKPDDAAPRVEREASAPGDRVVELTEVPEDSAPRRPLGKLGRTGIGVASVGVAALIGGGVLFARGRKPDQPEGHAQERTGRDFQPPGIASMAIGGGAVVAGAILFVVDRRRARRAAPIVVIPASGGLVVAGRF